MDFYKFFKLATKVLRLNADFVLHKICDLGAVRWRSEQLILIKTKKGEPLKL